MCLTRAPDSVTSVGLPPLPGSDWSVRLVIMRKMSATEFKAKCLAILDEVAQTGEVVTVLKHGRPVAQVVPAVPRSSGYPQDDLAGTIEFLGDVVAPVMEASAWEAEGGTEVGGTEVGGGAESEH